MGQPPTWKWLGMPMLGSPNGGPLVPNPGMLDFLLHFGRQIATVPIGKVLFTVWASYWVWLASRKPVKPVARTASPDGGSARAQHTRRQADSVAFKQMIKLIQKGMWTRHGAYFAAYITSLITRVFVTVKLADVGGRNAGYFGTRQWSKMFTTQAIFGVWCMVGASCSAAMKFLEKRVALSVREILYKEVTEQYFSERNIPFYRVGTSDPPARLTADLETYSKEITHLLGYFLKPAIDMVQLTYVLGSRLGGRSVAFFLFYFWFSSKSLDRVKKSMPISMKAAAMVTQECEGELRERHQKIHTYREQIAMQHGTVAELNTVRSIFSKLVNHIQTTCIMYIPLDVVTTYVLKYGGAMVGFSVLIPREYLHTGAQRSTADITAGFVGDSALLQALANAMKDLADSMTELPRVSGLAARVYRLVHDMKALPPVPTGGNGGVLQTAGESAAVVVERLSICTPGEAEEKTVLIKDLELEVKPGQATVVRGPNGVGKSSLFRVLSGLWQAEPSSGRLEVPASTFFMPQDCYFPMGTLLEQVTYPRRATLADRKSATSILERVGLSPIIEAHGLDTVKDWHALLSGGQKQRLAWSRMLHAEPTFAFIDEGTSAVSTEVIDTLYSTAAERGVTIISIAHQSALDAHHSQALDIQGGGPWAVTALSHDQQN